MFYTPVALLVLWAAAIIWNLPTTSLWATLVQRLGGAGLGISAILGFFCLRAVRTRLQTWRGRAPSLPVALSIALVPGVVGFASLSWSDHITQNDIHALGFGSLDTYWAAHVVGAGDQAHYAAYQRVAAARVAREAAMARQRRE